jgi:hypothetical protein
MDVTASIADRAKTRERRKAKPSPGPQWDDDDDLFLPQTKKKAKSASEPDCMPGGEPSSSKSRGKKGKGKAAQPSDVIDISDDDDELNLKRSAPNPKAVPTPHVTSSLQPTELIPTEPILKPRPKPRPVPKKPKANLEGQPENPVFDNRASTPAHPPPDTDLLSSNSRGHRNPLIPSSLPPSDPPIPTAQTEAYSLGVPAIETLPQPSSSNLGHKVQGEFDELFSGDEDIFGPELVPPVDPKGQGLPPPPTFFAGSSSQVKGDEGVPSMGQEGGGLNVTSLSAQPQEDPKPKAKMKKKAAEEDDDDGEWGAAPPKPKEKKTSKKKKAFSGVEVVITSKPPGKGKRDKEKKKDEGSSSRKGEKTKEVFKSREMIEDSDEDPLLESYRPEEEAMGVPLGSPSGYKGKPFDRSKDPVTVLEEELGMVEDDAGPAAKMSSKRKRKSMVVEDDDEFDAGLSKTEESSNKRQKKGKSEAAGSEQTTNPAKSGSKKQKGKAKAVIVSEDEEELAISKTATSAKGVNDEEPVFSKVSHMKAQTGPLLTPTHQGHVKPARPERSESPRTKPVEQAMPKPPIERPRQPRLSIGSRAKATPMSELIKRVNSLPNSPFPPATSSRLPTISRIATSYSPYLKASRSMLSRIAPLHPNRRTPPPPLPPPPPRKKTKKEIEREEKWEEELIDSLGGLEAWIALSDADRRDMRKAKFDMEMGSWDD